MLNHPEQKRDEIYLGNCTPTATGGVPSGKHFSGLKSARFGTVAYEALGKLIPSNHKPPLRPLFINKPDSELYEKIMKEVMRET